MSSLDLIDPVQRQALEKKYVGKVFSHKSSIRRWRILSLDWKGNCLECQRTDQEGRTTHDSLPSFLDDVAHPERGYYNIVKDKFEKHKERLLETNNIA